MFARPPQLSARVSAARHPCALLACTTARTCVVEASHAQRKAVMATSRFHWAVAEQQVAAGSAAAAWAVPVLAGALLSTAQAAPALASSELLPPAISQSPALQQEHITKQHMQQLPSAPQLAAAEQQSSCKQQQLQVQELSQVAQVGEGHTHWLLQVLGIGMVNVLGLWAVLKVLQLSKDSEYHVHRNSSDPVLNISTSRLWSGIRSGSVCQK
ncbi:hypothetical protein COO60DRAFT_420749 [Scenedesmus sp. NREL 46B-D3]|nr:hypothetical protein COO60DRAFT_420749 [Scenedesmus sp. NREL 46B-D3]